MPNLQPIADMRRVQLVNMNGYRYTSKADICQFCGRRPTCKLQAAKKLHWHDKVYRDCTLFEPILTFRPPLNGFEGQFNTFRLGPAWSRRVMPGSIVALFDTKQGRVFGRARVTEVLVGSKYVMAAEHGAQNHLMLGYDGDETVETRMLKILRNAFGKLIYESHEQATVVYLERLNDGNDDGTHQEGAP